jgi:hypothetical protein
MQILTTATATAEHMAMWYRHHVPIFIPLSISLQPFAFTSSLLLWPWPNKEHCSHSHTQVWTKRFTLLWLSFCFQCLIIKSISRSWILHLQECSRRALGRCGPAVSWWVPCRFHSCLGMLPTRHAFASSIDRGTNPAACSSWPLSLPCLSAQSFKWSDFVGTSGSWGLGCWILLFGSEGAAFFPSQVRLGRCCCLLMQNLFRFLSVGIFSFFLYRFSYGFERNC